jgi:hypothetical protein
MSPIEPSSQRPDLRTSPSEARRLHDSGAAWSRDRKSEEDDDDGNSKRSNKSRSGTIDSVQRREALSDKLGDVFGLDGKEDVIAGESESGTGLLRFCLGNILILVTSQSFLVGCSDRSFCRALPLSRQAIFASTPTCRSER